MISLGFKNMKNKRVIEWYRYELIVV